MFFSLNQELIYLTRDTHYQLNQSPVLARFVSFEVQFTSSISVTRSTTARCFKFEVYGCRRLGKQSTEEKCSSCLEGTSQWDKLFILYANNKNADMTAHPRSLISICLATRMIWYMHLVLYIRLLKAIASSLPLRLSATWQLRQVLQLNQRNAHMMDGIEPVSVCQSVRTFTRECF